MKIRILAVGKIKEDYFKEAIQEYIKRLSRYLKVEIIEIPDQSIVDNPSDKEIEITVDVEGEKILRKIKSNEYVILLDLNQKEFESIQFAVFLQNKFDNFGANLTFVIGGSYGLSSAIKERANDSFSLSKMTFTHQMTRVIFFEQVYRAMKILNNEVFHK